MEQKLFKNEYILAPVKLGYCFEKNGQVNDKHLDFYRQRAEHLGAIIAEPMYIDSGLRENPFQLGIDHDDKILGISQIAEIIHKHGGKFIVHINHPGRMANAAIPGNYFWSASTIACENGGATPIAMDKEMMNVTIDKFVQASIRAQKAGADYIELQFGYGYLLSQFLSPQTNQRTDEFGGSLENRMRFPLMVLRGIKQNISIPIIARVSATDFQPNGIRIEETTILAKQLEKEGVVAIHATAGSACSAPAWYYQHMFTQKGKTWELAAEIQKHINIPVIFHGRIQSPDDIDYLKKQYQAKYFSLGRALVADEDFVAKILGYNPEPIRPCLACSEGCLGGVRGGKGLGCVVNPRVNTNLPIPTKAQKELNIAVVGGGLAGLEAAITLKKRGHRVVLYEKNEIGGQFLLAYLPPKKQNLLDIVNYYKTEVARLEIPVIHKEATNEILKQENFDVVVMATGAVHSIPPIKGLSQYYTSEILNQPATIQNQKVVIIGGGLIGTEVASFLLEHNNEVIIVEMLDEIARGLEMIERNLTLAKFKQHNVSIHLKSKVVEVNNKTIIVEKEDGTTFSIENVGAIVIATGMQPYIPFHTEIPTHFIGDARQVAKAQDAIKDAYELALTL